MPPTFVSWALPLLRKILLNIDMMLIYDLTIYDLLFAVCCLLTLYIINGFCFGFSDECADAMEHDAYVEPEAPIAVVPNIGLCVAFCLCRETVARNAGLESIA